MNCKVHRPLARNRSSVAYRISIAYRHPMLLIKGPVLDHRRSGLARRLMGPAAKQLRKIVQLFDDWSIRIDSSGHGDCRCGLTRRNGRWWSVQEQREVSDGGQSPGFSCDAGVAAPDGEGSTTGGIECRIVYWCGHNRWRIHPDRLVWLGTYCRAWCRCRGWKASAIGCCAVMLIGIVYAR